MIHGVVVAEIKGAATALFDDDGTSQIQRVPVAGPDAGRAGPCDNDVAVVVDDAIAVPYMDDGRGSAPRDIDVAVVDDSVVVPHRNAVPPAIDVAVVGDDIAVLRRDARIYTAAGHDDVADIGNDVIAECDNADGYVSTSSFNATAVGNCAAIISGANTN